jgi:hypothetical protein
MSSSYRASLNMELLDHTFARPAQRHVVERLGPVNPYSKRSTGARPPANRPPPAAEYVMAVGQQRHHHRLDNIGPRLGLHLVLTLRGRRLADAVVRALLRWPMPISREPWSRGTR